MSQASLSPWAGPDFRLAPPQKNAAPLFTHFREIRPPGVRCTKATPSRWNKLKNPCGTGGFSVLIPDSGSECWGFESLRVYVKNTSNQLFLVGLRCFSLSIVRVATKGTFRNRAYTGVYWIIITPKLHRKTAASGTAGGPIGVICIHPSQICEVREDFPAQVYTKAKGGRCCVGRIVCAQSGTRTARMRLLTTYPVFFR